MIIDELFEAPQLCPECGGISFSNLILAEKKDACYHKVKASAKVWPSAYASGRLVQCRKKGASNYGNKSEGVAEGSEQKYLWHGSRQKIPMLEPRQSVDTGGAAGSNQNAIYATSDPKVAIAVGGLTTPDSDTAMFPNDPQMVLFSGKIRKGENVYLHKLPFYSPDGKPQFVQGAHDREFYSIPGVKGIKPTEIKAVPVDKYLNLIRKATPADLELRKKNMKEQGVAENAVPQLSVQQLATISDTALDQAYGYGRSTPGNTFGWQANLKSAAYAKQMIDQGVTDIEAISDAIHKGWNTTAQAFVQDPDQFDDTAKLAAAGKLQAKLQQRAQLMKQNYAQLPEEEKEKDRVVARALLQAMRGAQQPGMAEGYVPINISKMPTDPAPKPKKVEPKHKYVDNQADHEQYRQAREKVMYNVVGKFDRKVLNPEPIKGLTAAEEFMKQNGLSRANADLESISTLRFHASGIDASGKRVVSEPLTDMKDVGNFYKQHGINQFASTTDLTTTDEGSVTEGEQQPGADYRDPKEVDYDDEYDAMVARVKKLAGLGPLKTVYDPNRRVYKNVPTAVQPKK